MPKKHILLYKKKKRYTIEHTIALGLIVSPQKRMEVSLSGTYKDLFQNRRLEFGICSITIHSVYRYYCKVLFGFFFYEQTIVINLSSKQ